MDVIDALKNRKSIRAFEPKDVPEQIIKDMLELTINSPSAINLQPWEFYVVSGDEKKRLSRTLLKAYKEKRISCGPDTQKPLPGVYNRRGVITADSMKTYLDIMGLNFNTFINEGSCNFYGAPVVVLICIDSVFPKSRLVDIGIALAYFMLAAHAKGLETCPIGLVNAYKEEVKELLSIPDDKNLVISIALGYADSKSPINRFKAPRDELNKFVKWIA